MKLLQDQSHARGGCGKDLELPGSARELPAQAVPHLSPAAAEGIHTLPWPRAAVQHQWQQSRTKCQTVLQVSTEVALKIQIKTAQNQRQYGGDRPRDASAPTALCEHQSPSGSAAVFHHFGGALSPCGHKLILTPHGHTQLPANHGIPEVSPPLQVTAPCASTPSSACRDSLDRG